MTLQFGQNHVRHRRRRGQRGSADGTETRTRSHTRHRHAPTPVTDEGIARPKQRARQATVSRKIAHHQEERHDRQVIQRESTIWRVLQIGEERVQARDPHVAGRAGDEHGNTDLHSQCEHDHHHRAHRQANCGTAHDFPSQLSSPQAVCSAAMPSRAKDGTTGR
ncbi:hypothetical protein SDC9_184495 [bioreactor metagenome]|uniref:Uncharacterized protein n=1 Tax=bioreactor metagenome TaxID=1076179 RepID=A0A645HNF8_9ZZZZ